MRRQVFFSFHFDEDSWRAGQVRNMGVVEGNKPVSGNRWEEVKRGGNRAIKRWIDENLRYRSCTIVLIGQYTAGRKWINYEIEKSWNENKGLVGIYIHNLKDRYGQTSEPGENPFEDFTVYDGGESYSMASIVKCYDPPNGWFGKAYSSIRENLEDWVEEAIQIRNDFE